MDDGAFEALYNAHYDDLLRFALRRVDNPADAADVVAEAWAVAWRRRQDLPPDAESRLWLFGVARRVLANQRRGRLRQAQLAERLRDELLQHGHPPAVADSPAIRALRQLSATDRDLLTMLAWDELRPDEIASVLGCTPVAARVRIHRARRRLRTALDAEGLPSEDNQPAPLRLAEETR
jgi:RNA polymerase sigma factor (sigma-70 family)